LVCGNNQLATIDLAGCPNIERLIANNNKMTTIDLSGAKSLTYAKVYDNPFESVNVKGLANLDYLGLVNYDTNADRYGEGNIRVVRDDKGTAQKDEQGNVYYLAEIEDLNANSICIVKLEDVCIG
jgi:Leucine-rich repeat (LRR) protein